MQVCLHPGWVATDMGNSSATGMNELLASNGVGGSAGAMAPPLTAEQSVRGLLGVLHGLSKEDTGSFIGWDGQAVPW